MTEFQIFAEEEVTKVLIAIGIPANLQGFRCLRTCTLEVLQNPSLIKHVTKGLYKVVGDELSITSSVVERSMRHSTDVGYYKTGFEPLCKVFNLAEEKFAFKPTSSELIAMLAEYVRFSAEKKGLQTIPSRKE